MNDVAQMLASKRAVREMKDEHDRQGGVDPFKRPYELQASELAAAVDAIDGLLELRVELQEAGRVLQRMESPASQPEGLLASLESGRRERLRARQQELAGRWSAIKEKGETLSSANRAKAKGYLGDLLWQDPSASLGVPAGREAEGATRIARDVGKLAQSIQGLRDLLDARGVLAPPTNPDAQPPPQETARMSEEEYAKLMSLAAIKERIARMPQLPPAICEALVTSLSHEFPASQQRFLAAYVNAILSAANEEKP